jgi:hypothetical protein
MIIGGNVMAAKLVDIGGVKHIQVTFPLESPRLSSTGTSFLVGGTNEVTSIEVDGKAVRVVSNAMIKNMAKPKPDADYAAFMAWKKSQA